MVTSITKMLCEFRGIMNVFHNLGRISPLTAAAFIKKNNIWNNCIPCILSCAISTSRNLDFPEYARWRRKFYYEVAKRRKLEKMEDGVPAYRPRSWWVNWNYEAELFAFAQRLGENISNQTLRRAFTQKSFLETEALEREQLGLSGEEPLVEASVGGVSASSAARSRSSSTDPALSQTEPGHSAAEPALVAAEPEPSDAVSHLPAAESGLSVTDAARDNEALAQRGRRVVSHVIRAYVAAVWPNLPGDGVAAVEAFLTSESALHRAAVGLGCVDLVRSAAQPPAPADLCRTLLAVVAAVELDASVQRAASFVLDFLAPPLVEVDLTDVWATDHPLDRLNEILRSRGAHTPVEPRLIRQTGAGSIMSMYEVGLYSGPSLVGRAPGETVPAALEMAARDGLRRSLLVAHDRQAAPLGGNLGADILEALDLEALADEGKVQSTAKVLAKKIELLEAEHQ